MAKVGILVAGGTGGHINAALTLGNEFQSKGYKIYHITGMRDLDFKLYKNEKDVIHIESSPLRYKNPLKIMNGLIKNMVSFVKLFVLLWKIKPQFILGTGGYVCGPSMLAAFFQGVPLFLLEQNSVMGLTNRILVYFSKKIFVHFPQTLKISEMHKSKMIHSGNPIRFGQTFDSIKRSQEQNELHVLVFGGSLGAKDLNFMMEEFIKKDCSFKLCIKHQLGKNKLTSSKLVLGKNVHYKHYEYLDSIENEYAWADLILCRSGASTIAELRYVQRPVILIPYPQATDRHQHINAEFFRREVSFPVYIHDLPILQRNSSSKLREIIAEVFDMKQKGRFVFHEKNIESEKIIYENVVHYVSTK